jgi:hypothetical protein
MAKLIKTTFDEEQKAKQEWFLTLTGLETLGLHASCTRNDEGSQY